VEDGKLEPALLHQACNSDLHWSGLIASYLRKVGTLKVRAYSFEGELLGEGIV